MRHEIQGGRKFYKKYKKQSLDALTFKPQFQSYADINLHNIAKKVSVFYGKIEIYSWGYTYSISNIKHALAVLKSL